MVVVEGVALSGCDAPIGIREVLVSGTVAIGGDDEILFWVSNFLELLNYMCIFAK